MGAGRWNVAAESVVEDDFCHRKWGREERGGEVGITLRFFGFWFLDFLIIPDEIFYLGNLLGHLFGDLTGCFLQRNERNERSEPTDELTLAGPNDGWMDG